MRAVLVLGSSLSPLRRRAAAVLLGAAAAVATIGAARTAAAAPTADHIRAAADEFDLGVSAVRARDFEAAAGHFEAADRHVPSSEALNGAIRARRDARQFARAATLATAALERYPDQKDLATLARSILSGSAKDLHRVNVTCAPACVLVVDRRLAQEGATASVQYLEPGHHLLGAGWGDKNQSSELTATAGGTSSVAFTRPSDDAVAAPSPPPPEAAASPAALSPAVPPDDERPHDEASRGLPKAVFWSGVGVTALLIGVTTWSAIDTKNNPGAEAVRSGCAGQGEHCPIYQDGLSRQHRTNALLGATAGVSAITAVVGVFFTRWSAPETAAGAAARLTPGVGFGPEGRPFLSAAGRFLKAARRGPP